MYVCVCAKRVGRSFDWNGHKKAFGIIYIYIYIYTHIHTYIHTYMQGMKALRAFAGGGRFMVEAIRTKSGVDTIIMGMAAHRYVCMYE